MQRNKSFTLIEILVAVAIIGLLASVILVNIRGAQEKARMAKILEFSSSIYHTLGANAVAIWDFEEEGSPEGNPLDRSGNNNDCVGASASGRVTGYISENAFEFAAGSPCPDCYLNGFYPTNRATVELWFKITGETSQLEQYLFDAASVIYVGYWVESHPGGSGLTTKFRIGAGLVGPENIPIEQNQWYHMVSVYDGFSVKVYLNGNLAAEDDVDIEYQNENISEPIVGEFYDLPGNPPLRMGKNRYWPDMFRFIGILDELRIYKQDLTAFQIKQHYVEGLEKHKLVEN